MLKAVLLGLLLGLRHAADPDHVIAVSAIAARHRRPRAAALVGLAWGLGHATAVVVAGAALVVLGQALPERVALGFELAVGVVLIALGLANLRLARVPAAAPHAHGTGWRSFGVGLVHGLAGTAGLALLAVAAMPTPATAIAYLAVFGLGSTAGMVAVSLGLGGPLAWAVARPGGLRAVTAATGLVAVAFGSWMVWHAGVAQGLLS